MICSSGVNYLTECGYVVGMVVLGEDFEEE